LRGIIAKAPVVVRQIICQAHDNPINRPLCRSHDIPLLSKGSRIKALSRHKIHAAIIPHDLTRYLNLALFLHKKTPTDRISEGIMIVDLLIRKSH
jgi:hypothetical protein